MKSQTNALRKAFKEDILRSSAQHSQTRKTNAEKQENTIEWITLFRRNWHIYVDMILGIKLHPFQQLMIYLMGVSDIFFAICSRGLSKSFIVALGAIVKMNLYPYSIVVITSSTLGQANKLVEKKIRGELIKKLSPYLLYMYQKDYLKITKSDDGFKIENTLNGSILEVLPCLDSSRGERATLLIYEECRLLKKGIIDSVFEKMAYPRQPIYLQNGSEYSTNPRWLEECQHIYITSARYKYEWFWREFKKTFTRHFTDNKTRCNIFAGDIFMAIQHHLKTWVDYRNGKNGEELDFRMEDLNEMIGESADAFFSYRSFKENQILEKAYRLPTPTEFYMGTDLGNPIKTDNEIRLLISDFAFANTTSKTVNDHTIIMLMSLHWKKTRFERHVDYLGTYPASDSVGVVQREREIFWDYLADYFIPDLRSGGEVLYNLFTMPTQHEQRGSRWDGRGFTVVGDKTLHVVPDGKISDLVGRTVDKNALPCVVPIVGTSELNSVMWKELKKQLESNNIKFLMSMQHRQDFLEESGRYFDMSPEELAEDLAAYGQMDMLANECVNLQAKFTDGVVKLTEPRSGFKDRAICLAYGNYIASKLENQWNQYASDDDFDIDNVELVF